jgi:hypothetical protein
MDHRLQLFVYRWLLKEANCQQIERREEARDAQVDSDKVERPRPRNRRLDPDSSRAYDSELSRLLIFDVMVDHVVGTLAVPGPGPISFAQCFLPLVPTSTFSPASSITSPRGPISPVRKGGFG